MKDFVIAIGVLCLAPACFDGSGLERSGSSAMLGDGIVQVNVCSGPDAYSIDYDRAADHVITTVSETSNGRQLEVYTETNVVSSRTGEIVGTETSTTTFQLMPSN
jgi:hypothetical protein